MFRKVLLAALAAAGVMMAAGGTAVAGHCRHGGGYGYGPRHGGFYGRPYGYGYGGGVVIAPRVVYPQPYVYPSYGYPYGGYPYGYGGGYGPYNQAFGIRSGNFSLFLGR